jgi:hypothetical protein
MKNIHILPTDKPSRLILQTNGALRLSEITFKGQIASGITQNIYITSDEEIKDGDYFWKPDCNMIFKAEYTPHKGCQKVILTTDQDLIKDGVQAIDDEFLEWFVKNLSCEKVEVEGHIYKGQDETEYKIIIPKEEHKEECECTDECLGYLTQNCKGIEEPKQETLEEVAERLLNLNELDSFRDYHYKQDLYNAFIIGIKYQQKISYSEEELKSAFLDGWQLRDGDLPFPKAKKKWFNEFKNK